jgi:hypothetical protein
MESLKKRNFIFYKNKKHKKIIKNLWINRKIKKYLNGEANH